MRKGISFALEVDGVGPTLVADMRGTVNVFNVCPDFCGVMKSDARTPRTPRALSCEIHRDSPFSRKLWSARASLRRYAADRLGSLSARQP
jgi:hypothetical protein